MLRLFLRDQFSLLAPPALEMFKAIGLNFYVPSGTGRQIIFLIKLVRDEKVH